MNQASAGLFGGFGMQAPIEPALDEFDLPIDGCLRTAHQRGSFLGGAAKKVPQFHKLNLVWVTSIQFIKCALEVNEGLAADIHPRKVIAQRDVNASASPHLRLISTSVINQNPAHHLGGEGIKMPSVFIGDALLTQEFKIELMHDSGV